ncbi:MAG TPA: hypothetical protein VKU60_15830, partial [Chloroflexota bacterium]|nr:hypothetical protein [Chloroflexota bacterium]
AAFELAADPEFAWDDGEQPWQAKKLYHIAHSRERGERLQALLAERGLDELALRRDRGPYGVPDAEITTRIDVSAYVALKRQAILCHRSQTFGGRWAKMPEDLLTDAYGEECFLRVRSLVDAPAQETDLFAGTREAISAEDYSLLFANPVGTHFVA